MFTVMVFTDQATRHVCLLGYKLELGENQRIKSVISWMIFLTENA